MDRQPLLGGIQSKSPGSLVMSSALESAPLRSSGADWFLGSGCPLGVVDEGFDDTGEGAFFHGDVDLLRPQEDLLTNPPERAAGPALLGNLICMEPSCHTRTRQLVVNNKCVNGACKGKVKGEFNER